MCYWRRLSKRSVGSNETANASLDDANQSYVGSVGASLGSDLLRQTLSGYNHTSADAAAVGSRNRKSRQLRLDDHESSAKSLQHSKLVQTGKANSTKKDDSGAVSEKVSLFQALEVRQEREPDFSTETDSYYPTAFGHNSAAWSVTNSSNLEHLPLCYRRVEVYAFLITVVAILTAAISITVGCCLRAKSLRKRSPIYHNLPSQVSPCASARPDLPWSIQSANQPSNSATDVHHHINPLKCCILKGPAKMFSIPVVDCDVPVTGSTGRRQTRAPTNESPANRNSWDSGHLKDRLISNSLCY